MRPDSSIALYSLPEDYVLPLRKEIKTWGTWSTAIDEPHDQTTSQRGDSFPLCRDDETDRRYSRILLLRL